MWMRSFDTWAPPGLILRALVLAIITLLIYLVVKLTISPRPAIVPQYRTCADFNSQAEAQAALPLWPRLDGDRDGVACERLVGRVQ